jgi:hypothetical protein
MTTEQEDLARAIAPLVERVRRDTCVEVKPGKAPARVDQPLSDVKVRRHLSGGTAYGAYPMLPGSSTTRVALLDMDSHRGETAWPDMQTAALRVMQAAEARGLLGTPFRSGGGKGVHVYFLWEAENDAYSVRALLADVLADAGFTDGAGGVAAGEIEIFPKQDRIEPGKFGNMFVIPGARKSVPLDTFELEDSDYFGLLTNGWPMSSPVAPRERPATSSLTVVKAPSSSATWRQALDAIPNSGSNELPYDDWFKIIAAIDFETEHSDEGLQIALEFNARAGKDNREFFENRVWPYLTPDRDRPITGETIKRIAAEQYGWEEDVAQQFEVLPASSADSPELDEALPDFLNRNPKTGIVPANSTNIYLALKCRAIVPWTLGYDSFRDDIMRLERGGSEWVPFDEVDYPRLAIALEAVKFGEIPHANLRRMVAMVAHENTFDSAMQWLTGLPAWDGVKRCETFLQDCMGVEDTPYTRAVSRYMWSALAGRVLSPGVKAKMAVILTGLQNAGKSTLVETIAPSISFFTTLDLSNTGPEMSRLMRGRLLIELPELKGMRNGSIEHIKAMISRTHEDIRNLYAEKYHQYARRFIFIGTTNDDEFLVDRTGNSRFLPVRAGKGDLERIARDREQLWAEGAALFGEHGVMWEEAEGLAQAEHQQFMVSDTWEEHIAQWLDEADMDGEEPRGYGPFLLSDVLHGALGLNAQQVNKPIQMRAADSLKALGYVKQQKRVGGAVRKVWIDSLLL